MPISSAVSNMDPLIAFRTSFFVAPSFRFSILSIANSLKKYRCSLSGGFGPMYPIFLFVPILIHVMRAIDDDHDVDFDDLVF